MDELIELFSVINQLEKGALGLFFELNYLIGIFNTGHCIYFTTHHKLSKAIKLKKETALTDEALAIRQSKYDMMENFISFQYYYSFFCLIMVFVIFCLYRNMDKNAEKMTKRTHEEEEQEKDHQEAFRNNQVSEAIN